MIHAFELEEEVERLHELEVIPRIKCMQCHTYMPSGTKSSFCLKCSKKRISMGSVGELALLLFKNAK